MELDWSAQSPHIRPLFHPWQPGDGYDEEILQVAEARLGVRLPATLRNFYLAWGRRRDMTETLDPLLPPDDLRLRDNTLIFWVQNEAVVYWGVPFEALEEADPPVVEAWNLEEGLEWTPSHAYMSDFLDDMTYENALLGGALYEGHSVELVQEAWQIRWLEEHWRKARVGSTDVGNNQNAFKRRIVYIREGQAVSWHGFGWLAAAGSAEGLNEIAQGLQITWKEPDLEIPFG